MNVLTWPHLPGLAAKLGDQWRALQAFNAKYRHCRIGKVTRK